MIIPTMQLLSIHALQDLRSGIINDIAQRKKRHAPYKALENYLFKATACIMQKRVQRCQQLNKARHAANYQRLVNIIDATPDQPEYDWQNRKDLR